MADHGKHKKKARNLLKKLAPHARKTLASKQGRLKDTGSLFGLTKGGKAYVNDRIGPADALESLVHKLTGKK